MRSRESRDPRRRKTVPPRDLAQDRSWFEGDLTRAGVGLVENIEFAQDWYVARRLNKRRWAKALRLCAVILGTAGGVIPIAAPMIGGLSLLWGYLLIAAAAGAQLIDSLFGFSSAWSRYSGVILSLGRLSQELRLLVESYEGGGSSDLSWPVLQQFSGRFWDLMQTETHVWVADQERELELWKGTVGDANG